MGTIVTATSTPTAQVSPLERWYALAVLTIVYVLSVADRFVISTLIEPIKADLQLSDSSTAFLTGVSLAVFYVTFALPIAVYADRANRRNLVALALAVWSAMTALCGATQTFWQLVLARFGVGIGEAGGVAPANALISDKFPWNERALAFTIFAAGSSFGSMLGSAGGYLSDAFGWRSVFFFFGVPGLLIALLVRLTVKEPRRGGMDARPVEATASLKDSLRMMLSTPSMRLSLVGITFFALWGYGLMWWTPAFLKRSHGLSVGDAGGLLVPIHGIGGTIALVLTSWLMSTLAKRDPRYPVWFIVACIVLAAVPSFIAYSTESLATARLMLWIFIPIVYAVVGPFYSLIQNLAPANTRTQAAAITFFVANVANLIIAPQGVGVLSDVLAARHGVESLRFALLPVACTSVIAAVCFFFAGRTVAADMRRAGSL